MSKLESRTVVLKVGLRTSMELKEGPYNTKTILFGFLQVIQIKEYSTCSTHVGRGGLFHLIIFD